MDKTIRKRIYEVIEKSDGDDFLSSIYDYIMMAAIIASLLPLAFKAQTPVFAAIDKATVTLFILDYLLRLGTADYKYPKDGFRAFLRYPFSLMAVCMLAAGYILVSALEIFNKWAAMTLPVL